MNNSYKYLDCSKCELFKNTCKVCWKCIYKKHDSYNYICRCDFINEVNEIDCTSSIQHNFKEDWIKVLKLKHRLKGFKNG